GKIRGGRRKIGRSDCNAIHRRGIEGRGVMVGLDFFSQESAGRIVQADLTAVQSSGSGNYALQRLLYADHWRHHSLGPGCRRTTAKWPSLLKRFIDCKKTARGSVARHRSRNLEGFSASGSPERDQNVKDAKAR